MLIKVPMHIKIREGRQQIHTTRADKPAPWAAQKPLLLSVALARAWQRAIDDGQFESITALASHLKLDYSYVARLMNLNLLDAQIITDIVNGTEPSGTSLEKLTRGTPYGWDEQRRKYGWPPRGKEIGGPADSEDASAVTAKREKGPSAASTSRDSTRSTRPGAQRKPKVPKKPAAKDDVTSTQENKGHGRVQTELFIDSQ